MDSDYHRERHAVRFRRCVTRRNGNMDVSWRYSCYLCPPEEPSRRGGKLPMLRSFDQYRSHYEKFHLLMEEV